MHTDRSLTTDIGAVLALEEVAVFCAGQQHEATGVEGGLASSNAGLQYSAVAERPHERQRDRLLRLGLPQKAGMRLTMVEDAPEVSRF